MAALAVANSNQRPHNVLFNLNLSLIQAPSQEDHDHHHYPPQAHPNALHAHPHAEQHLQP